jgi:ribosomal protein L37AE/L43A
MRRCPICKGTGYLKREDVKIMCPRCRKEAENQAKEIQKRLELKKVLKKLAK